MNFNLLAKIEINLERRIYKQSFYEFYKSAYAQLHPGQTYDENWHAIYLCQVLQEEAYRVLEGRPREKDIIINISPRSSKSMIVSVIWPIWCWTLNPTFKFLTCSYSDQIATILARQSRDLVTTKWCMRLYGGRVKLRADLSGAGHYGTDAGGYRYSFGLDGTVTGIGGDFLICDDLQNPKKANSEIERANTIERYNGTISNRLNQLEIGSRIMVMQRLHEDDICGHLMNPRTGRPEEIRHICIPAEYDEAMVKPPELKKYYVNNLFWQTRFSQKVLNAEKKKGSLYFAGQFQQRPVPLEGNIFKRAWFDIISPELITRDVGRHPIHFYIDTAYTEDEINNDPSGILSTFEKDGTVYIMNFVEVWREFPELVKFIGEYCSLNGYNSYSSIKVEPKASGKSIVQQLRASSRLNVVEIDGDWVKDDKVTRATSVSPITESRRVKLIEGAWNDAFLTQICSFPKASHDEGVDCLVYCLNDLIPLDTFLSAYM